MPIVRFRLIQTLSQHGRRAGFDQRLSWYDMACSWTVLPPGQLRLLAGPEHGRTIPLAAIDRIEIPQRKSIVRSFARA